MIILRLMPGGLASQMSQQAILEKFHLRGVPAVFDLQDFKAGTQLFNGLELRSVFGIAEEEAAPSEIFRLGDLNQSVWNRLRRKIWGPKKTCFFEEPFDYNPALFDLREAYLFGYYSQNRYYHDIRDHLLSKFRFPELDALNREKFTPLLAEPLVSIHVRRGDYLNLPIFQNCVGPSYYENAIRLMNERVPNARYVVFSDDIPWCQENLVLGKDAIFVDWNKGAQSYRDMQLMSLCRHNIIANSGFSYWGAYLGTGHNRIVIAPRSWYNDPRFRLETTVPAEWVVI
ncbi:MAG: alpha-1,2-fucosyltransferase [Bdellovibrionaceae bacterium]|nr:alpha-1,2-fucosyltransferase [Pseudobdellovibrionaceae bacterium]